MHLDEADLTTGASAGFALVGLILLGEALLTFAQPADLLDWLDGTTP